MIEELNKQRIREALAKLSEFSVENEPGVTRESYSKEDKDAKEYLRKQLEELGLTVYEDGIGTLFGRLEGKLKDAPVVMIGSHYDTVVHGGMYDGAIGVIGAIEVVRVLKEIGFENDYPIEIVCMNAEEGATFGTCSGFTNSRAMVGRLTYQELEKQFNRYGKSKLKAMQDYGLKPDLESCIRPKGSIKNFIELHNEQGVILDNDGLDIGIVGFLPGQGRYKVTFKGQMEGSSSTMDHRKDALVAASEFIFFLDGVMKSFKGAVTSLVGDLKVTPNSRHLVNDYVELMVELRVIDEEALEETDFTDLIDKLLVYISTKTGVFITLDEITRESYPNPTPPSYMNEENVEVLIDVCDKLGYYYEVINDGTGHDSQIMTEITDVNMIYVPSALGVTHSPEEFTNNEAICKGIDVLLEFVKICSKIQEEEIVQ